ncbi:MAG TPA: DUF6468 domain-containing protein [Alphaproteobacteria bacterium]|nr:DUF6468 domain-containing protein [Alphaproteobacteria bacterium]HNS44077.1 DUF6468 domain-containing protein [Alphaproteobacteria bacterium]
MSGLMLGLDIVIIVMLGATIFYAARLGKHLSIFRANRSEMERLIRELSSQITRAQEGISTLDDISSTQGDHLRQMVAKAQGLCDELEIMTEAGNSLAERLEKLASKNRAIADDIGQNALNTVYPGQKAERPEKPKFEDSLPRASKERVVPSLEPSFAIRDPDYEEETDEGNEFMSKAERDLASALKNRNRK